MSEEFWKDGLRFECQPNCGACCSHKGYVFVTGAEIHRLATYLKMPTAQFRKRYLMRAYGKYSLGEHEDGRCVFLDNEMKCTVYDARPDQCRAYPFWPRLLADRVRWEWEGIKCPGIGKGEIIPASEIKRISELYETK